MHELVVFSMRGVTFYAQYEIGVKLNVMEELAREEVFYNIFTGVFPRIVEAYKDKFGGS